MGTAIGIDLGTTNSVVAFVDPGGTIQVVAGTDGARIVPSVVYFPQGADPVVGERAKQYALVEPDRVARVFKRGMGERTFRDDDLPFVVDGKEWSPEELSSLVLKKLKQTAEDFLHEPVEKAVITVPAYFGEPERAATRTAGELAGLQVLRLLNEPTAAAFAHGIDQSGQAGTILVFDLGGGTFDVTIMRIEASGEMTVIATGGDRRLGGSDFDRMILDRMATYFSGQTGTDLTADPWGLSEAAAKAEDLKKELSTANSASRPLAAGGKPAVFSLSRPDLEAMLADTLRGVEDTVAYTIESAGLPSSDIETVLMVGGSSRIPAFPQMLQRVTGKEPVFSRNLDEDVARGAATLAAKSDDDSELDPRSQLAMLPVPKDICSHGLGVTCWTGDGPAEREINSILIQSGAPIPATGEEVLATRDEGQRGLTLVLNEGDDEDLRFVRKLGETDGTFSEARPKGHPVRVTVSYTQDQLIRAEAYDGQTGAFLCDLEVKHSTILGGNELAAARSYLSDQRVE